MVTRPGKSVRASRCGRRIGTSCLGPHRVSKRRGLTSGKVTKGNTHLIPCRRQFTLGRTTRQERAQMSEPTDDGKHQPDADPERERDKVQDPVQDEIPDSVYNDPTAPVWADPTAPIPAPPTPPGAASSENDEPAAGPDAQEQPKPPVAPALSNPYAQQPPAPPYGQPPAPPYGQAQSGQQYPAYSQQPYATGQPSETNGSAIVLTVLSGVSLVFCNVLAIASLVLGIVALTKNTTDREGSRRLTKIGWIVFAVVWAIGILGLIAYIVFIAAMVSGSTSSTTMLSN